MSVLITGANGFVGKKLTKKLSSLDNFKVSIAIRNKHKSSYPNELTVFENMDLSNKCDWSNALENIDFVIHLGARAHILDKENTGSLDQFNEINVNGTINLASQAKKFGVKRFIFLSSIGVHGDETTTRPFDCDDTPQPQSPYSKSKLEAEKQLLEIMKSGSMGVTIIRSPLVYGADAPGNFGTLLRYLNLQIPLPLGSIKNKRSFIYIENLVDFICCCINNPKSVNQIFLVSDNQDLSISDFLRKIIKVFGKKTLLLPTPIFLLKIIAKIMGGGRTAQQLTSSLQVNIEKSILLLGWTPPYSIDNAVLDMYQEIKFIQQKKLSEKNCSNNRILPL